MNSSIKLDTVLFLMPKQLTCENTLNTSSISSSSPVESLPFDSCQDNQSLSHIQDMRVNSSEISSIGKSLIPDEESQTSNDQNREPGSPGRTLKSLTLSHPNVSNHTQHQGSIVTLTLNEQSRGKPFKTPMVSKTLPSQSYALPQERRNDVEGLGHIVGVPDLLMLEELKMDSVLQNTKTRYFRNEIYTAVGPPILISVNPYSAIPKLYTLETASRYHKAKDTLSRLPPHLYRVAQTSLTNLFTGESDQAIVISGESGAGKTEATKIILGYLSALDHLDRTNYETLTTTVPHQTSVLSLCSIGVENQIIQSNPILESFGNAKTIRNDNSSRFGKFTQLFFNLDTKSLVSARISNYLLEKSRIVVQQEHERNYHIFYQLCAGSRLLDPKLQEKLSLDSAEHFDYLSRCLDLESRNDLNGFKELLDCLYSLDFSDENLTEIFGLLSGILHLGNVSFDESNDTNGEIVVNDLCQKSFEKCCELFGLEKETLLQLIISTTITDAPSQGKIVLRRTTKSSMCARDSLCKAIYERLFYWIVDRINRVLYSRWADDTSIDCEKKSTLSKRISSFTISAKPQNRVLRTGSIGLLDIFGFEVFDFNSFEQLCINYANEQLQQHFNLNVFREEQSLYQEEGIDWNHIKFEDNSTIIDALTNKIYGVFSTLDSECLTPGGCDANFLQKILSRSSSQGVILMPSNLKRLEQFGIVHYAGPVYYNVEGMLVKNRDVVYRDFCECFQVNGTPLLRKIFQKDYYSTPLSCLDNDKFRGAKKSNVIQQNFTQSSVSFTFRTQLNGLMELLQVATASYIKCIKPNSRKLAKDFDTDDIIRQFKCAGMLESIRIRKTGYAIRIPVSRFWICYRELFPQSILLKSRMESWTSSTAEFGNSPALFKAVEDILRHHSKSFGKDSWQVGRTKVFMKEDFHRYLENLRLICLSNHATKIASHWRGYRIKRRYRVIRDLSMELQSVAYIKLWRYHFYQDHVEKRRAACLIIQTVWRQYCFLKARRVAQNAVNRISDAWIRYKKRVWKHNNLKTFSSSTWRKNSLPSSTVDGKELDSIKDSLWESPVQLYSFKGNSITSEYSEGTLRKALTESVETSELTRKHSFSPRSVKFTKPTVKSSHLASSNCSECVALKQEINILKVQLAQKATSISHLDSQKEKIRKECDLLKKQLETTTTKFNSYEKMYHNLKRHFEEQQDNLTKVSNEREYLHSRLMSLDKELSEVLADQKKDLENKFSESLGDQKASLLQQLQICEEKLSASEETINSLRHLQKLQRKRDSHDIEDHPLVSLSGELGYSMRLPSPLYHSCSRYQTIRKENDFCDTTDSNLSSPPMIVEPRASRSSRGEGSFPATYIALKEEAKESKTLQQETEILRYEKMIVENENQMLNKKINTLQNEVTKEKEEVERLRADHSAMERLREDLSYEKKKLEYHVSTLDQEKKAMDYQITKLCQKNAALLDRLHRFQQHQKESDFRNQLGVATTCDLAQQKAYALLLEYQADLKQKHWKNCAGDLILDRFQSYINKLLKLLVASPDMAAETNHMMEGKNTYRKTSPLPVCVTHRCCTSRRLTDPTKRCIPTTISTSRCSNGYDEKRVLALNESRDVPHHMPCATERLRIPPTLTERSTQQYHGPQSFRHAQCHPLTHKYSATPCFYHGYTDVHNAS